MFTPSLSVTVNDLFKEEELLRAAERLQISKTAGPDRLTPEVIKLVVTTPPKPILSAIKKYVKFDLTDGMENVVLLLIPRGSESDILKWRFIF